jgi:hypothetical protein
MSDSTGFAASQRSYYKHEINRALPTQRPTGALGNATIQQALGLVDPATPSGTVVPTDATSYFSQFGESSGAVARDAECRGIPYPGPAMRDPAARTGCGWWFVADPTIPSTGAYGSRRGAMSPTLDTQIGPGRWIWDPREAQQAEGQKRAARVAACPDIAYANFPNVGWCPGTGMAIVTDGAGNPAYPQAPGGDCPAGGIVMNPAACPPPPPPAPGVPAGAPPGITGLCTPQANGALSPACLQAIASWQCSASGTLATSLGGAGYAGSNPAFASINGVLAQRGFQINPGIINNGQLSIADAFSSVSALQRQAATGDGSRATSAAANLCYGSPFDPCALADGDSGPYDPDCVTRAAQTAGWAAGGALMPAVGGMGFWNGQPTWGAVKSAITTQKQQADNPPPAGGAATTQVNAIKNVYGLSARFPRTGCNNQGVALLRYFCPANAPQSLFPIAGPQTHFLGRYLAKNGFPNQTPTSSDMTPAGGFLTECQRYTTVFAPTTGGNYQFLSTSPDPVRISLNGQLLMDWQGSGNAVSPITEMIADQLYTLTVDIMNSGGAWGLQLAASVNGGAWAPLPSAQLFLPADRRLPVLELAFNKMTSGSSAITDTNGILPNLWARRATAGTLGGRQCLLIGGSGSGVFNTATYSQGIRSRALRSMTMMLNIQSITLGRDGRGGSYTPSFVAFYNLPSTNIAGYPRSGAPPDSWDFPNRTADFEITGYNGSIYAYGKGPSVDPTTGAPGPDTQTTFTANLTTGPISYPPGQWFHFAFVWDDDFSGYAVYINGKLVANLPAAVVDPLTIYEQIRIGSDATDDGAAWTGGIAWFRGYDYRLSPDLIARDMSDDWADLY